MCTARTKQHEKGQRIFLVLSIECGLETIISQASLTPRHFPS